MDDELDRLFKEGRIHPLTYKYIKEGAEKDIVDTDKLIKIKLMRAFRYSGTNNFRRGEDIDRRNTKYRGRKSFKSTFHRDLFAMKEVWEMLKSGAIRSLGEIGRQY